MDGHDTVMDAQQSTCRTSIVVHDLTRLTACRELVASVLSDRFDDERLDAEIVVSELVTNAFEHGEADSVTVHAQRVSAGLALTVVSPTCADSTEFRPRPSPPPDDDPRGRGMLIVSQLASSYRVRVEDGVRQDEVVLRLAS